MREEKRMEMAVEILKQIQWSGKLLMEADEADGCCPCCGAIRKIGKEGKHEKGCKLKIVIDPASAYSAKNQKLLDKLYEYEQWLPECVFFAIKENKEKVEDQNKINIVLIAKWDYEIKEWEDTYYHIDELFPRYIYDNSEPDYGEHLWVYIGVTTPEEMRQALIAEGLEEKPELIEEFNTHFKNANL